MSALAQPSVVETFPGELFERNFRKIVPFSEEINIYVRKRSLCNPFVLTLKSESWQNYFMIREFWSKLQRLIEEEMVLFYLHVNTCPSFQNLGLSTFL